MLKVYFKYIIRKGYIAINILRMNNYFENFCPFILPSSDESVNSKNTIIQYKNTIQFWIIQNFYLSLLTYLHSIISSFNYIFGKLFYQKIILLENYFIGKLFYRKIILSEKRKLLYFFSIFYFNFIKFHRQFYSDAIIY